MPAHDEISSTTRGRQVSCHNPMAANTMGNSTVQSMAISVMSPSQHIIYREFSATPAFSDLDSASSCSQHTVQLNSSSLSSPQPTPSESPPHPRSESNPTPSLPSLPRRRRSRLCKRDAPKYALVF